MIDQEVFRDSWKSLCRRLRPNVPLDANEAREWHEFLSEHLTTEQFRAACRKLWIESKFFPRPADFLEAALGSPEERAAADWELCEALMGGSSTALGRMSEAGRRTVALMGGQDRLRQTLLTDVPFRRREFLQLHGSATGIHERENPAALVGSRKAHQIASAVAPKLLRGDS